MLVLSRRHNETIVLPTLDVEVTVVEVRGDRVRLGIEAPKSIPVHREEIWLEINAKKQQKPEEPDTGIEAQASE